MIEWGSIKLTFIIVENDGLIQQCLHGKVTSFGVSLKFWDELYQLCCILVGVNPHEFDPCKNMEPLSRPLKPV
jgi:hypothetical protein